MSGEFQISGQNAAALFTLKLHRGDGITLVAMNWKIGRPPQDFVGFAIEYKEPNGDRFFGLKNRLGFEARNAILEVLDKAIADNKAQVRVVAYDLSEPDIVSRLEKLGRRLKIIIDDSKDHGEPGSGETQAAARLLASAGTANVKRQHMLSLQHNKTIVVDGPKGQMVVCGSTNFSWRGFFVQSNNALILQGASAVKPFLAAFED